MRYLFLIFLITLFTPFFMSCKKNISESTPSLIGKWELRERTGGFLGGSTTYPAGNGDILKFTNTHFERYFNGQIVNSGTYNLTKDTFITGELIDKLILTNQNPIEQHFIKIESNQFTFLSDAMDGIDELYKPVQ